MFGIIRVCVVLVVYVRTVTSENVPEIIDDTPSNVTVHEGDVAHLKCHFRNIGYKMVTSTLLIRIVRAWDDGGYECRITTEEKGTRRVNLHVIKRSDMVPEFIDTLTNVTGFLCGRVVLPCHIRNVGVRTVVWRKVPDTEPLTVGLSSNTSAMFVRFVEISLFENQWNLEVFIVTPGFDGVCEVRAEKKIARQVNLHVISVDD